jgi:RHS repeat-associated protein
VYDGKTTYRLASETRYPTPTTNEDALDREATSYAYTFFKDNDGKDTHIAEFVTVTEPTVSTAHNGPGAPATTIQHYRSVAGLYYNDWTKRADGTYSYTELGTSAADYGQVVKSIADANSNAVDVQGFPNHPDWPARTTGLHLKTTYEYCDASVFRGTEEWSQYGTLKAVTDPGGKRTAYAHQSCKKTAGGKETTTARVTLVAPHMQKDGPEAGHYGYAPVQITVSDLDGRTLVSASGAPATSEDGNLTNDLSDLYYMGVVEDIKTGFQGELTDITKNTYNENGQILYVDQYHDIKGDKIYRTKSLYDDIGRQYKTWQYKDTYTAEGNDHFIAWTEYDQLGRPTETWAGTDDTDGEPGNPSHSGQAPNNLKKTSATFYDESDPGSGTNGVGDGYATSRRGYYDKDDSGKYVNVAYHYNWRGFLRGIEPKMQDNPAIPYSVTVSDVDNLGRTVATAQYQGNLTWSDVLADEDFAATQPGPENSRRAALSKSIFDEMGRICRTETYSVDSTSGAAGNKLVFDNYYDIEGRLVGAESLGQGGMEYAYDGAGRRTESRTVKALKDDKFEGLAFAYRNPQPAASAGGNDGVAQITRNGYDGAGNPIKTLTLEVNHNGTDGLFLTAGQENFVQSGAYAWYDKTYRQVATGDYGSGDANNEWKYAPPPARAEGPPAFSSDGLLVTRYAFDEAGLLGTSTDAKGHVAERLHDSFGRRTRTIENRISFSADESNFGQGSRTGLRIVCGTGLRVDFNEFTSDANTLGLWHLHNTSCQSEPSGLKDASGGDHDLANQGASPREEGYRFVRAETDAADAAYPSQTPRSQVTLECWVRGWDVAAGNTGRIMNWFISDDDRLTLEAHVDPTAANSYIRATLRVSGVNVAEATWTGTAAEADTLLRGSAPWHVAVVLNAPNTLKLFVNGVEKASVSQNVVALPAGDYTFRLGQPAPTNDLGLEATLDEVRLSSTARYSGSNTQQRLLASGTYESLTSDSGQAGATWTLICNQLAPTSTPTAWEVRAADSLDVNGHPDANYATYVPASPPSGRYFQFRATLTASNDRLATPTVRSVEALASADDDQNRSTLVTYDGLSNTTKLVADLNRNGEIETASDQVTTYAFANDYNPSLATKITYPDSESSTWDVVDLDYHLDGTVYTRTGQRLSGETNRTVITFNYDDTFHRLTKQRATTLGDTVDNAVQSMKYTYDALGRNEKVTSYSDAACTTIVNEVQYAFGDLGQLAREYQAHAGAVNTETTLYVGYDYMASAQAGVYTKGMRLKSVRYPNERLVHYRYGSEGSIGEMLSRLTTIQADSDGLPGQTLASYAYNGVGRMVREEFPQPGVALDYFQGAAGRYAGFDRFGRIKDQRWHASGTDKDRYQYGYDYGSNRLWRQNALTHGSANKFDEFYTYDGLDRLKTAHRGTLGDPPSEGLLTTDHRQEWKILDAVGNWDKFNEGSGSAWTLQQTRYHNAVNEITNITQEPTQTQWIVPGYDARGNMTAGPKPGAEGTRIHLKYDAWNRLVKVTNDAQPPATIAEYRYDGLDRRIVKLVPHGESNWDRTDYYYNSSWQCLEERYGADQPKETVATAVKVQWVWSVRYIDAPVLRWRDTGGDPDLDETLYYCTDANMNVTALVGTDGAVVERYTYDPYGKVTFRQADWQMTHLGQEDPGTLSAYANEVLYCGYRYDPETGMYLARHRYYDPTLGRWVTWDPTGHVGGRNSFEYVASTPESLVDAYGLAAAPIGPPAGLVLSPTRITVPEQVGSRQTRMHTENGNRPCFAWTWVAFGLGENANESRGGVTLDLRMSAPWRLSLSNLRYTNDCFCCPSSGRQGRVQLKQWVQHPSQNDTWRPDMTMPAPPRQDIQRRERERYTYADPASAGGQWQPNRRTLVDPQDPSRTTGWSWADSPNFLYSMRSGVSYMQNWWFYIEVWRDCLEDYDDARIDAASFYLSLTVTMLNRGNVPLPGYAMSTRRGNEAWEAKASLQINPILWQQQQQQQQSNP